MENYESQESREAQLYSMAHEAVANMYQKPEIAKRIKEFHKAFTDKYGKEAFDYNLFHILIGSTPEGAQFDTPDHEVEKFLLTLE